MFAQQRQLLPSVELERFYYVMERCLYCGDYQTEGHRYDQYILCPACNLDGDALEQLALRLIKDGKGDLRLTDAEFRIVSTLIEDAFERMAPNGHDESWATLRDLCDKLVYTAQRRKEQQTR